MQFTTQNPLTIRAHLLALFLAVCSIVAIAPAVADAAKPAAPPSTPSTGPDPAAGPQPEIDPQAAAALASENGLTVADARQQLAEERKLDDVGDRLRRTCAAKAAARISTRTAIWS